ncbi:SpoIIE family protein phosphatase [Streptomyces solicathayae]|uniref:SpoIIE family protein phosphatase n=1 Tax=Streptomyces solicathayae TaxID=3081768 RepID=A0ABZ0LS10_9ACTN|nr:SpoIIE family protein phosphatase [Streptomyces sp. HUAS YS2]WOX21599.1 SpoIIE family protein phosphatase [Streptomyces sp. HUAS YS2]
MATTHTSRDTGHQNPFGMTTAAMIIVDAQGKVIGWSPTARDLYGADTRDVLGRSVSEVLRDVRAQGDTQTFWAAGASAPEEAWSETRTVRRPDGSLVETVLRIFPVEQDRGQPAWVVMAAAGARYRQWMTEQSMLSGLFTQAPVALSVYGPDLRLKWVNAIVREVMGWRTDDWVGQPDSTVFPHGTILSPSGYRDMDEVLEQVLRTGEAVLDLHWHGPTPATSAHYQVYSCSYFRLQDDAGRPLGVCEAAVDITERYEAQSRLALLSRAGGIGTTLDIGQTVRELAELVVPDFADSARIEVAETVLAGEEALSSASGAPTGLRLMVERTTGDPPVARNDPLLGVIGSPSTTEGQRLLALPLLLGGTALGTVALGRQPPRAPFTEEDRALAEELASRTAVCVDNARRYIREHGTALKLQRELLPQVLPRPSGIELAHRYIPATGPLGVGGDWYDVIPLSGARVGLVVGDVVGHGVDAAATMGRLRTSVRALAALDLPPDELLTRLDDLVSQARVGIHRTPGAEATDRALGATCLYAVYDPSSRTCAMASAGHLPPVASGGGTGARQTEALDLPPGPPLGIGGLPFESKEFEFAEGTVLALFTDGMVEARSRDVDEGVADLCGVLDAPAGSLQQACDEIVSLRVQGSVDDDAALLLVRIHALPADSMAFWHVASDPAEVAGARALVRGKLEEWGLDDAAFVLELVVSELVTNAIRYGRPPVSLRLLRAADHTLICEVSDGGHTSPHLRRAGNEDEGGRGLFLVAQFTGLWGTRYSDRGKTIWAEIGLEQEVPLDLLVGL